MSFIVMTSLLMFGDVLFFLVFFFFKQKTAYEMRISDWSSDVCSSDLFPAVGVAWHFGDEEAVKDWGFVSLGKLRASWGRTGNAPTGAFDYLDRKSVV